MWFLLSDLLLNWLPRAGGSVYSFANMVAFTVDFAYAAISGGDVVSFLIQSTSSIAYCCYFTIAVVATDTNTATAVVVVFVVVVAIEVTVAFACAATHVGADAKTDTSAAACALC